MSVINAFPGYEFVYSKGDNQYHNMYRGVDLGFGGYVYAEPGMYSNVALLDVASMHPNSAINMNVFGEHTSKFKDILDARIAIKHGDYEAAGKMFDGRLKPFLTDKDRAAALSQALKISVNSVYGLTSAKFENPFKDPRNKNNIVALRGALFMKTLQDEVQARGFTVAHIKTDSIKVADATPEIIQFVVDFGKKYGYTFEHEATYSKMCLVNNAVYIAKYKDGKHAGEWTATGAQFAVPYVFKKLFSREEITLEDLCETKEVKTALYLESSDGLPDVSDYEREQAVLLEDIWRVERNEEPVYIYKKRERLQTLSERIRTASGSRYNKISDEIDILESELREFEKTGYDLESAKARVDILDKAIAEGHSYRFIGKVSSFCPIKPGRGGGVLLRQGTDKYGRVKYSSATGADGYFWLEAETVKLMGKEQDIDRTYYDKLVDAAVASISSYGDFEWFVADDILPPDGIEELPWLPSCGNAEIGSCWRCPHLHNDQFHLDCRLGHDISDIIVQKRNLIEKEK